MDEKKLMDDIKKIVDDIFSEKEQASQMQKTQDALNESAETIDSLTQSLELTKAELLSKQESADVELKTKDSKIAELSTELEAAQKKVTELETEIASSKEALENIKKDKLAEARISELKENKIAILNELETQTAKVREMSEEEFASYKQDRIALRQAVEKELEEAATAAAAAKAQATNSDNTTVVVEGSPAEDVTTPAPKIDPGQTAHAFMNFETNPSSDLLSKYAAMGKAMAENIKSELKSK